MLVFLPYFWTSALKVECMLSKSLEQSLVVGKKPIVPNVISGTAGRSRDPVKKIAQD